MSPAFDRSVSRHPERPSPEPISLEAHRQVLREELARNRSLLEAVRALRGEALDPRDPLAARLDALCAQAERAAEDARLAFEACRSQLGDRA